MCHVVLMTIDGTVTSHERHGVSNHRQLWVFFICSWGEHQMNHQSYVSLAFLEGNLSVTVGFPSWKGSNAERVFMPWYCSSVDHTLLVYIYIYMYIYTCFILNISITHPYYKQTQYWHPHNFNSLVFSMYFYVHMAEMASEILRNFTEN